MNRFWIIAAILICGCGFQEPPKQIANNHHRHRHKQEIKTTVEVPDNNPDPDPTYVIPTRSAPDPFADCAKWFSGPLQVPQNQNDRPDDIEQQNLLVNVQCTIAGKKAGYNDGPEMVSFSQQCVAEKGRDYCVLRSNPGFDPNADQANIVNIQKTNQRYSNKVLTIAKRAVLQNLSAPNTAKIWDASVIFQCPDHQTFGATITASAQNGFGGTAKDNICLIVNLDGRSLITNCHRFGDAIYNMVHAIKLFESACLLLGFMVK